MTATDGEQFACGITAIAGCLFVAALLVYMEGHSGLIYTSNCGSLKGSECRTTCGCSLASEADENSCDKCRDDTCPTNPVCDKARQDCETNAKWAAIAGAIASAVALIVWCVVGCCNVHAPATSV